MNIMEIFSDRRNRQTLYLILISAYGLLWLAGISFESVRKLLER